LLMPGINPDPCVCVSMVLIAVLNPFLFEHIPTNPM
jgi:hypothetical protein